ncbi:MAG: 2-amino-4-hydroxy-6-hydroxymethyldihydropteridine diphosphokinase [Pseudomonadota bacterium]|jgi:2-amino-4-hydroxy-6-hydroxymethyldihydropteridine diphosphokinase
MPRVYVGIGSNIDRDFHISSCLQQLSQTFAQLILSGIYEAAAVGFDSDPFYNLVVSFETELEPLEVAQYLAQIEIDHGRAARSPKFSAHTLDLDILLYGDLITSEGRLRLPRADITQYAFVLEPLAQIAPEQQHPLLAKTYRQLWAEFDQRCVQQTRVYPKWLNDDFVQS